MSEKFNYKKKPENNNDPEQDFNLENNPFQMMNLTLVIPNQQILQIQNV